jgi:hypothetical protein
MDHSIVERDLPGLGQSGLKISEITRRSSAAQPENHLYPLAGFMLPLAGTVR